MRAGIFNLCLWLILSGTFIGRGQNNEAYGAFFVVIITMAALMFDSDDYRK